MYIDAMNPQDKRFRIIAEPRGDFAPLAPILPDRPESNLLEFPVLLPPTTAWESRRRGVMLQEDQRERE